MSWDIIRKKLFRLTVVQSFIIIIVITLPLLLLFLQQPFDYQSSKKVAHLSLIYFSTAFILYLFLYTISHSANRAIRKKLVLFTRVFIRFHIAVALMGTVLIMIHVIYMFSYVSITNPYAITGSLALAGLMAILVTGYLRKQKSSGKRRRYHRYVAILFLILVLIHIVI